MQEKDAADRFKINNNIIIIIISIIMQEQKLTEYIIYNNDLNND